MTSPRRKQGSPIESVSLTITFRTTKERASQIRKVIPSTRYKSGTCEVKIATDTPTEAESMAKDLLEKVREIL
jgi:hypothetical protein